MEIQVLKKLLTDIEDALYYEILNHGITKEVKAGEKYRAMDE